MKNKINEELWDRFLSAVQLGQIEGIEYRDSRRDDRSDHDGFFVGMQWLDIGDQEAYSEHCWDDLGFQDRLTGALQRWTVAKGFELVVTHRSEEVDIQLFGGEGNYDPSLINWDGTSGLHKLIAAVLWVLEQEAKGQG